MAKVPVSPFWSKVGYQVHEEKTENIMSSNSSMEIDIYTRSKLSLSTTELPFHLDHPQDAQPSFARGVPNLKAPWRKGLDTPANKWIPSQGWWSTWYSTLSQYLNSSVLMNIWCRKSDVNHPEGSCLSLPPSLSPSTRLFALFFLLDQDSSIYFNILTHFLRTITKNNETSYILQNVSDHILWLTHLLVDCKLQYDERIVITNISIESTSVTCWGDVKRS